MAATKRVPKLLEGMAYHRKAKQVAEYVERYFSDHKQTEWPTVRSVSYHCNVSQANIAEFCNEGIHGLMKTEWHVSPPTPLREHFVEICK